MLRWIPRPRNPESADVGGRYVEDVGGWGGGYK